MFRQYYQLAKPGIIYGNSLTLLAGFFMASKGYIDGVLLVATVLGTALVMACGCVLNNYIDRGIDEKMQRTSKRALVTGAIPARNAIIYGIGLGVTGFGLLLWGTNTLTVVLGGIALVSYVAVYGIVKRRNIHGTLVGTLPGALPPVAGYTAVTNQLDLGALLLFLVLVLWQLAHFYAIAIYRANDYKAANIPVLSLVKGFNFTKKAIIASMVLLLAPIIGLVVFGYVGYIYAVLSSTAAVWWLITSLRDYHMEDAVAWARKTFFRSLIVLTVISISLCIDAILRIAVYNVAMILVMHIVVALLGLCFATYSVFAPSQTKLGVVYLLSGLTLASGTYLVFSRNAHVLEACTTGLLYFSVIIFLVVTTHRKLATATSKH